MRLRIAGENTLLLYLGDRVSTETVTKVQAAVTAIEQRLADDIVDLIPSYTSVLIIFNPLYTTHLSLMRRVRAALKSTTLQSANTEQTVTLPVYYSTETGADLSALANRADLSIDAVIALHTAVEYRVLAIGFAPGFAFMGQVDPRIAAPRKKTPRVHVPAGTVGIAERQTAVYPAASPGGWNLIGRCPVTLFNPDRQPPMLLRVGDRVRFEPVQRARYLALGGSLQ